MVGLQYMAFTEYNMLVEGERGIHDYTMPGNGGKIQRAMCGLSVTVLSLK